MTHTPDIIRAMTAGRELDVLIAEHVMGMEWDGGNPIRSYSGEWPWPYPVSTDPAANAELKRRLWVSGRFHRIEGSLSISHGASVFMEHGSSGWGHDEPITDDPIAAEMLCWCKIALLAAIEEGRAG